MTIPVQHPVVLDPSSRLENPFIGYRTFLRGLAASQITVSGELAEGPRDAPLRADTYEYWQAPSAPAYWQADLGKLVDIDYIGVVATLGSSAATIGLEVSRDGASWQTFASGAMPTNDLPRLFIVEVPVIVRYLKLTFTGAAPKLMSVYAGMGLRMDSALYGSYAPITMSRETVLEDALSDGGQFLGQDFRRHGLVGNLNFKNLEPAWVRSVLDPFIREARRYPYFFAWRPREWPEECAYVWTREDIRPSYMGDRPLMQASWPIRGIGSE